MCSACLVFLCSFECHWSVDVQMRFVGMFISDYYRRGVIGDCYFICCLSNGLRVTIIAQVRALYYRHESQLWRWSKNNLEVSPAHRCL